MRAPQRLMRQNLHSRDLPGQFQRDETSSPPEWQSVRLQIAHELHDNIIQTLVSAALRFEALGRGPSGQLDVGELDAGIEVLHEGIADLQDLMERLRPRDVDPSHFLEAVASVVQRFRRDSGIDATFLADPVEPTIAPATCRQLLRIVQEGLTNVRRHSGAQHVIVRLRSEPGVWRLSIDDDGRGFPFDGLWSLHALELERRGPLVIKERAHAIGADLFVESHPGRGARVEIILPKTTRA